MVSGWKSRISHVSGLIRGQHVFEVIRPTAPNRVHVSRTRITYHVSRITYLTTLLGVEAFCKDLVMKGKATLSELVMNGKTTLSIVWGAMLHIYLRGGGQLLQHNLVIYSMCMSEV